MSSTNEDKSERPNEEEESGDPKVVVADCPCCPSLMQWDCEIESWVCPHCKWVVGACDE